MKEYHDLVHKILKLKDSFWNEMGNPPIEIWLKQSDIDILAKYSKVHGAVRVTGMGYDTVAGLNIVVLDDNSPIDMQVGSPYLGGLGEWIIT